MSGSDKTVFNDKINSAKKKINFKQMFNILLITLLLVFILQNLENIRVKLLLFSFEMPLFILIIVSFSIGFFSTKLIYKEKK